MQSALRQLADSLKILAGFIILLRSFFRKTSSYLSLFEEINHESSEFY